MAVIHKVKTAKEHFVVTQQGNIPPVHFVHNDCVIDLLDLLRGTTNHNCLENVIVIVLIVEAAQEGVIFHESDHCVIVVVNNCVFTCFHVLENEQPVLCAYFAVKDRCAVVQRLFLLSCLI